MPRNYKKSETKPRQLASNEDDMLQMMKAVKLDNKKAYAVSQSYNIPKTNLYRLLKEYDEQMGADDVTE